MSIFKHSGSNVKEAPAPSPQTAAAEGQAAQPGKLLPPFMPPAAGQRPAAAPGVVPPPAAPVYSMRPPEAAQRAGSGTTTDDVKRARAAAVSAAQIIATRAMQRATPDTCEPPPSRHSFDRVAATQAGLLKLAWKWQEAGAPIRAIHTYIELLTRYPDTPGADAAVADLVELSDILTEQGQFHTALAIYDHLEELLA